MKKMRSREEIASRLALYAESLMDAETADQIYQGDQPRREQAEHFTAALVWALGEDNPDMREMREWLQYRLRTLAMIFFKEGRR